MHWKKELEFLTSGWPDAVRRNTVAEIRENNDTAERLGFTCEFDDRLGYGRCMYINGNVRVWLSPDGWCRGVALSVAGQYLQHKYYHTLSQALKDEHARAYRNEHGELRTYPTQTVQP